MGRGILEMWCKFIGNFSRRGILMFGWFFRFFLVCGEVGCLLFFYFISYWCGLFKGDDMILSNFVFFSCDIFYKGLIVEGFLLIVFLVVRELI